MNRLLNGLVASVLATSAHAEFLTGNDLLKYAESGKNSEYGLAMGYVLGVSDALQGKDHCTPANVSSGQVIQLVKDKLRANAKYRHHSADLFVGAALMEAWPCKKGTGV